MKKPAETYAEPTVAAPLFDASVESPVKDERVVPSLPVSLQPRNMLDMVMSAAMDPTLDPARLEKFLQIARDLELDKKKTEWSTAFREAKNEIDAYKITKRGQIVYEGKGGKQGGVVKFIRYDDIASAVKPILAKYLLSASFTYRYESTPPKAICVMNLLHANGHSRDFESIPLPMIDSSGGKNDVQGAGSVMQYGRRYVICGAFDIVAEGEDTNGSGPPGKPITPDQLNDIKIMIQDCATKDPEFQRRFMRWISKELRVEALEDLYQGEPQRIVLAKLGEKQRDLGL